MNLWTHWSKRRSDEKWLKELRRVCRKTPRHFTPVEVGHMAKLMSVGRKAYPW